MITLFAFNALVLVAIAVSNVTWAGDSVKSDRDSGSHIYVSEDVGKNGKKYFIQYRRLGDTDTYVHVRNKALGNSKSLRKFGHSHEDDHEHDRDETPGNLQMRENSNYHQKKQPRVLDEDWNHDMNKTDFEVPELAYELYRYMEKNDRQNINNATVIKCLFELPYDWIANNIFEFDMSSLRNEELEILDAELHVYRVQEEDDDESEEDKFDDRKFDDRKSDDSKSDDRKSDGRKSDDRKSDSRKSDDRKSTDNKSSKDKKHQKKPAKKIQNPDHMVRLFQRMPIPLNETNENTTLTDLHKLLSVRYISSTYQGWQTFKVKSAVEGWLTGDINLGLMITATDPNDDDVELLYADKNTNFGQFTPILTVYMKHINEEEEDVGIQKPDNHEPRVLSKKIKPLMYTMRGMSNGQVPCSRHIWYVNFQDLGWDNFIVAPKSYMAYRCKGSCLPKSLVEQSNHGKILKFYEDFDYPVEGPRCSPTSYKPLVMMFYDSNENIVIKNYKDMIVEKCGCR